jgi:hypothetical protein
MVCSPNFSLRTAEENFCLVKAEENLSRQLWVAGVRVFSRPWRHKFPPVLKSFSNMLYYNILQNVPWSSFSRPSWGSL